MRTPQELVDNYLAIWNETDAAARTELILETWGEDLTYVDPTSSVAGHHQLDALIAGFRDTFPDVTFRQVHETEAHNNVMRFSWELVKPSGEIIAAGTDVAVLEEGRIQNVGGFYDQAPVLETT